jgi:hypothetical protein
MMNLLCHAKLFFQSSCLLLEGVAPSSAADQLLILFPIWRAGPSPIPPTQVDPISLRVQAPFRFFVGYSKGELLDLKPNRNNFLHCSSMKKNLFPCIRIICRMILNLNISAFKFIFKIIVGGESGFQMGSADEKK